MASILIRDLDENIKQQIAAQARSHGRSMESEARDILTKAARARQPNIGLALLKAGEESGGAELEIPPRTDIARAADFE